MSTLALASLLTGILQSLGTTWGLFRHYWILFKLLINLIATIVLLTYMETFALMAAVAADPGADLDEVRNPSPLRSTPRSPCCCCCWPRCWRSTSRGA